MSTMLGVIYLLLMVLLLKPPPLSAESSVNGGASRGVDDIVMRRDHVREMMRHAWNSYVQYAWGENELRPVSKKGNTRGIFGKAQLGATIIESLSTLHIMGLMEEFKQGRDWIEENLVVSNVIGDVSVFEVTTRLIGGLLSCFALTGDEMFREKAVQIAEKLLPAFESPSGVPYNVINFHDGFAKNYGWASGGCSILAEVGGLHLEFSYLSNVTGNDKYRDVVQNVRQILKRTERSQGLYYNYISPKTGKWCQSYASIGAYGDAFYEYLMKVWLQSGRRDQESRLMFDDAMSHVIQHLLQISHGQHSYFGSVTYDRVENAMDHLACFSGGLFGLAARTLKSNMTVRYLEIAEAITATCHDAYEVANTKLGPQVFRFTESVEAKALRSSEKSYNLRPEVVESFFYLSRITKDPKYRDWGWEVIQALEKNCRVDGGYTGFYSVYSEYSAKDDVQQTFFLAATLKYLYLLFSEDSLLPLDEWVFNTAGHPLPILREGPLSHNTL